LPEVKQPGRDANQLHPSNAAVKYEWSYDPTYVIQDFHRGVHEIVALPGCYAR